MAGDTEVTVIWDKDGSSETFTCYSARTLNGVLHCTMRMHSGQADRHIPLEKIREYRTREL